VGSRLPVCERGLPQERGTGQDSQKRAGRIFPLPYPACGSHACPCASTGRQFSLFARKGTIPARWKEPSGVNLGYAFA